MSKIIITFGYWGNHVAVNPKDLAKTLEFIKGMEFVDSEYTDGKDVWFQREPRDVRIELIDEVLPQRPAE